MSSRDDSRIGILRAAVAFRLTERIAPAASLLLATGRQRNAVKAFRRTQLGRRRTAPS